jgi:tetratricopeptide (TPR) repeat protein
LRHNSYQLVQRAWAAYQAQHFDLAEKEARGALALEPNDPEALSVLSLCAAQRQERKVAVQLAEQAIGLVPDEAIYYYRLAAIHGQFADHEATEPELQRTLELDPAFAPAYALYAWVYFTRGDYNTALNLIAEALKFNPLEVDALNLKAQVLQKKGDASGALRAAKDALRADPENYQAHAIIGEVQIELRNRRGAISHLQEALRIDPDTTWVRKAYSDALEGQTLLARSLMQLSRVMLAVLVKGSVVVPIFFTGYLKGRQGYGVPSEWHPVLLGVVIAFHAMMILAWWGPLLSYFTIPRKSPDRQIILAEHGLRQRTRTASFWQFLFSATILISAASIFIPGDKIAPLACVTGGIGIVTLVCTLANSAAARFASKLCAIAVCLSAPVWFSDPAVLQPARRAQQKPLSKFFPITVVLSIVIIPALNEPRRNWLAKA